MVDREDEKELERVRSAALKMLRAEFPALTGDHEDLVQQALIACIMTNKVAGRFLAHVLRRTRGLALDRAKKSSRELLLEPQPDWEQAFVSGKRRREKSTRSRAELDRIGLLLDSESRRLEHYVASTLIFDDDFATAHFAMLGRLIESELKGALPADFVARLMAFTAASARLSSTGEREWNESDATERFVIVGVTEAGKKPGRRRGRRDSVPLKGATEFRLKRRDVGRLIAAHALELCGFSSEDVHDLGRREARRESAFRKRWTLKLEEASAAEPDATDERILELALLSVPGGPGIAVPADQPPDRHPAFRRRGQRAK